MFRKLAILVTTLIFGGVLTIGAGTVFAQGNGTSTFASELAQKLGIDQGKVQQALDSIRVDRQTQRGNRIQTKLDQDVKDGKITSSQEQAILSEITALKSKYSLLNPSGKTPKEKRNAIRSAGAEFKAWANSQGIDLAKLGIGFGPRMHVFWGIR